jgi:D-glycero-alpha-D-manno-heptose-7-phosphate kinase
MIITRTPLRISFLWGWNRPSFVLSVLSRGEVVSTALNKYVYITINRLSPLFSKTGYC